MRTKKKTYRNNASVKRNDDDLEVVAAHREHIQSHTLDFDKKKLSELEKLSRERHIDYKYIAPFQPLDWQVAAWRDKSQIVLCTGSAGGGKSRVCAEKLHAFCLKYPGATALILRKERATMSNSTLLFIARQVIGNDKRVIHRKGDFRFEYDNGSILAYGGMKDDSQRERIRSIGQDGSLDIVWMEEATQFTEQDYNEVLARMRGKAADWTQIILSTNPDAPGHWINIRLILGGEASVHRSKASDNIYNPDDYTSKTLEKLSGVQYRRLVLGEWAAGAGRVFNQWDDNFTSDTGKSHDGNVTLDAEYDPAHGGVYWAIDDGYSGKMDSKTRMFTGTSHPRAIMFCQVRADGIISVFAESLRIETLADEHIRFCLNMSERNGWPRPVYAIRDRSAASLEGALTANFIKSRYNTLSVEEGIKEMHEWVAPDSNGVRKIIVHPRCFYMRYEMQTYSYDLHNNIIKEHDHSIDAIRYFIWEQSFGRPPVVDIATLDSVM